MVGRQFEAAARQLQVWEQRSGPFRLNLITARTVNIIVSIRYDIVYLTCSRP